MAAPAQEKRKIPPKRNQGDARAHVKRQKLFDAREIRTQASHAALNDRKELDVAKFIKSRESEIHALEAGIIKAKSALATRAFQQVPRYLRRRSASHNVKRVPKRLRTRALKEKREDNTPTVTSRSKERTAKQRLRKDIARQGAKESISQVSNGHATGQRSSDISVPEVPEFAPVIAKKFKKRQIEKSWLPTHLFHAKRARMTLSHQSLWHFAIPLTPTEKSYRLNHRASTLRGCVAWDTSYVSSIRLRGHQDNIIKILEALSLPQNQLRGQAGLRWVQGLRSWLGWVYECDCVSSPIAPVVIIWSPEESSAIVRQVLIRVHPSAFSQLWQELVKLGKMQRPAVALSDLRFALGSIEVAGPAATEALVQVLRPTGANTRTALDWPSLASVTNLATLSRDITLGFDISDPRLFPTSPMKKVTNPPNSIEIFKILSHWPYESEQKRFELLDDVRQMESRKNRLTQRTINKRMGRQMPKTESVKIQSDPSIPVILYTSRWQEGGGLGDSWIVLLPWEHVSSVWSCLLQVSLSSGGQPRFGGLQEQRQLFFETKRPWFPGDFPGTNAGWEWEIGERERRKASWERQPKGKRVCWEQLDLGAPSKGEVGRGWACDWEHLYQNKDVACEATQSTRRTHGALNEFSKPVYINQDLCSLHGKSFNSVSTACSLVVVSLTLTFRGHVSACARIYRLPLDSEHRTRWEHSIATSQATKETDNSKAPLAMPSAADLIGYVTSGNYNLGKGQATAIGSILRTDLVKDQGSKKAGISNSGLCIVRDAGVSTYRLARWEMCL